MAGADTQAAEDTLRDIKGYYFIEIPIWLLWFLAILLLLAIAAFVYFRFFYGKNKIELSAYEIASQALSQLQTSIDSQEYYLALVDIFRQFLDARAKLPALEKTDEELQDLLFKYQNSGITLSTSQLQALKKLLNRSSLAKFARSEIAAELKAADKALIADFIKEIENAIVAKEEQERAQKELEQKNIDEEIKEEAHAIS